MKNFKNFSRMCFVLFVFVLFWEIELFANNERGVRNSSRSRSVRSADKNVEKSADEVSKEKILTPDELLKLMTEEEKKESKSSDENSQRSVRSAGRGRGVRSAGGQTSAEIDPNNLESLMKTLEKQAALEKANSQTENKETSESGSARGVRSRKVKSTDRTSTGRSRDARSTGRGVRSASGSSEQTQPPTNVALNKKYVESGSVASYYNGEKALDGNALTFWYTNDNEKNLTVDLGKEYRISRYVVKHHLTVSYRTSDFDILKSSDNKTWTVVDSVRNNSADKTDKSVDEFTARYVQIAIIKGMQNSNSIGVILDFEVYGVENTGAAQQQDQTPPVSQTLELKNVALNKKYIESGSAGVSYNGARAIDGSATTFWFTNDNDKILTVDLEKEHTIWHYVIKHYSNYPEYVIPEFVIQKSSDNKKWTNVDSVSNNKESITDKNVTEFIARYVRVAISKGCQSSNNSAMIIEFELWGVEGSVPGAAQKVAATASATQQTQTQNIQQSSNQTTQNHQTNSQQSTSNSSIPSGADILSPNSSMKIGDKLTSKNGKYRVEFKTDNGGSNRFYIYDSNNNELWYSKMNLAGTIKMWADGKLSSMYPTGYENWKCDAPKNPDNYLQLTDAGDLRLFDKSGASIYVFFENKSSGTLTEINAANKAMAEIIDGKKAIPQSDFGKPETISKFKDVRALINAAISKGAKDEDFDKNLYALFKSREAAQTPVQNTSVSSNQIQQNQIPSSDDILGPNGIFKIGNKLLSKNANYKLEFKTDNGGVNRLYIYDWNNKEIWYSTLNLGITLKMGADGKFSSFNKFDVESNICNATVNPNNYVQLTNGGDLKMFDKNGKAIFTFFENKNPQLTPQIVVDDMLTIGEKFRVGNKLVSKNGQYSLEFEPFQNTRGILKIYEVSSKKMLWASEIIVQDNPVLMISKEGKFSTFDDNGREGNWKSNVPAYPNNYLKLTDNGDLNIFDKDNKIVFNFYENKKNSMTSVKSDWRTMNQAQKGIVKSNSEAHASMIERNPNAKKDYSSKSAIDGDPLTHWVSSGVENDWLAVFFESPVEIDRFIVNWDWNAAKEYKIQITKDNVIWTDIVKVTDGFEGSREFIIDKTIAIGARVLCVKPMSKWGCALNEFEVNGLFAKAQPLKGANIAKNKKIFVSSFYDERNPAWANDGNQSSYWMSQPNDGEWITVDIGGEILINGVSLNWRPEAALEYIVSVSSDNKKWTDLAAVYNGKEGKKDISFNEIKARYVKINCLTRLRKFYEKVDANGKLTEIGFAIYEFEVWSAQSAPVSQSEPENLALNKPVSASSQMRAGTVTSYFKNATDGNPATKWMSEVGDKQTITVDLEANATVNKIIIDWVDPGVQYKIQVSPNNYDWIDIAEITKGTADNREFSVNNVVARYIRMSGTKAMYGPNYSIREIEVYGKWGGVPAPIVKKLTEEDRIELKSGEELKPNEFIYHATDKNKAMYFSISQNPNSNDENKNKGWLITHRKEISQMQTPPYDTVKTFKSIQEFPIQKAYRCVMEKNGNLVVYTSDNKIAWETETEDNPGATASINEYGELQIVCNGKPIKKFDRNKRKAIADAKNGQYSYMYGGSELKKGESISNANKSFTFTFTNDGYLELSARRFEFQRNNYFKTYEGPIFSTRDKNKAERCVFEKNGQIVLYDKNGSRIWETTFKNNSASDIVFDMDDKGNINLFDEFQWSSRDSSNKPKAKGSPFKSKILNGEGYHWWYTQREKVAGANEQLWRE
ncbi:discoidin domain-containing protein [Candidatus Dependentiae bacterium]|nr:discoidin domain-containing protein [Candidatus Dependentiae bacterium]